MYKILKSGRAGRLLSAGLLLLFLSVSEAGAAIRTSTGAAWNAAGFGGTLPAAGDTVIINSNLTGGPGTALSLARLVVNSGFTFTQNSGFAITVTGGLLVDGTFQLSSSAITVNGTTEVNGLLTDNSATGANVFAGLVQVNAGGQFNHTSGINAAFDFRSGIINDGIVDLPGTGVKSFSITAAQSLGGSGTYSISTITVAAGVTLTNNWAGTFTFSGTNTITGNYVSGTGSVADFANGCTLAGAGSFTISSLNLIAGRAVTHSQTGAFTVTGTSTINGTWTITGATGLRLFSDSLTINTGGILTGTANAPCEFRNGITNNGTLSLTGTGVKTFSTISQALSGSGNISLSSVSVPSGLTLTNNSSGVLTLGGTTTLTGTLTDGSDNGSFVFSGTLSIPASGSLSSTTASAFTFSGTGGVANSGSLNINGAGAVTFSANQAISGAGSITLPVVNLSSGVLTISNTGTKIVYGNFNVLSGAALSVSAATGPLALIANLENAGNVTGGACPFSITGFLNSSAGTITIGGGGLTVSESVSLTGTAVLNLGSGNVSITGSVTLAGTSQLTDGSSTGANVFGGLVTVGTGCSMSTALNSAFDFRAGLACDGTVSLAGTGQKSFTVFNQNLSGAGNITLGPLSIPAGIILTNNNTGTCTFGSATSGTISGTLLDGVDGGSNTLTGLITVASGGSISSTTASPWNILTSTLTNSGTLSLTGSGAISVTGNSTLAGTSAFTLNNLSVPAGITLTISNTGIKNITSNCSVAGTLTLSAASGLLTIGGNLSVSGTYTNGTGGSSVAGNSDLSGSGILNANSGSFTSVGPFTLTGTATFTDASATGTNTFAGLVSIGSGCTFTTLTAAGINLVFRGGIANNGNFSLLPGTICTFNTNSQVLDGSNPFVFQSTVVAAGITLSSTASVAVTFNATLTLSGVLNFTGGGLTTLNGTTFSGAGQAVFQTLQMTGATVSQTGSLSVLGNSSVLTTNTAITATAGQKTFTGLLSIPAGLSLSVSSSAPLQFMGGISCDGTFSQTGAGAVSFTGSQSIEGSGVLSFGGAAGASQDLLLSQSAGSIAFNSSLSIGDTLYVLSSTMCSVAGAASLGSLYSQGGSTLSIGAGNFTVSGTSTIGGLVVDIAVGGVDTFTGSFSILSGGELRELAGVSNSNWVFGGSFTNAGTFNNTSNGAVITFNGNVVNTGSFIRNNAMAAIILNNTISFSSSNPIAITSGGAGCVLTVNGTVSMDLGANSFSTAGDLNVTAAGNLNILSTGTFTVGGNTTVSGTLDAGPAVYTATGTTTISGSGLVTDGNDGGSNTFTGSVTLSTATATLSSSANSPYTFAGGISNAGSVNLSGTGTVSFDNTQTISGAGAYQFQNFTVPVTRTLTISATGTKIISGDVIVAGTLGHSATSGGLTIAGTLDNSGSVSGGAAQMNLGAYNASGAFTNGSGASTVNGGISLSGSGSINMNNGNFSALGTTSLSGTASITDASTTGSNLFAGLVTVGTGCSFNNSLNSTFEFRGGIQNDGTFSLSGTGAITFSTADQSISGSSAITLNNATINSINLTNNLASGITIVNTCTGSNGSSQWTQASGSVLNFQGTNLMPTGILTASATGNSVNFSGAGAQNIKGITYFNLGCQGGNTKTLTQNLSCLGDLNIASGVSFQAGTFNVVVNTITNAGTFSKSGAGSIQAGSAVTLSGAGVFSGMTGNPAIDFQGGIVMNSSGNSGFGAGTVSFSVNDQSITGSGSGTLSFGGAVQLNNDISVTNQKTVSITGNLDATGSSSLWNNDNGSVLNYGGSQLPFNNAGSLIASANANTVNYNGAAQTILTATYHHLGILGSGVKTLPDVTINGNFSHTAGTLSSSGTQTFAGSVAATVTTSTTTLSNVAMVKPGSSLSLAGNLTVANSLTLTSGTFSFGPVARTLTVNGDLSGSATLDMSGIAGNTLVLAGANNSLGTYLSTAGNTVSYTRAGNQVIFSSPSYRKLSLSGSGVKSLSGNTSVSDTLYFTSDLLLSLGSSNLTMNEGSRLRAGASGTNGAFGVNRMIVTGGAGSLVRNGSAASDFTTFSWSSAGKNAGVFPVGTTGLYSPCEFTSLMATVSGTGSISVNAIATKLPTVPFYYNSLAKYWDLSSSNLSSISANIRFTYNNPAEVIGNQALYLPRVWDGSTLSAPAGASAIGTNPFSTTGSGFITGQWTAVDITPRNAYYTYISGEWNDPNIWTTDPSGSTRVNEKVPGFGDQVFILNGDTVSNANGDTVTVAAIEVENGAVLDLGSVQVHSLGPVSGSGLIRLNTIAFPAGNFTQFVAASGGTLEYYDLPSGAAVLPSGQTTYNNLVISNSTGSSFTIIQNHNLTINGGFSLSSSGAAGLVYQIGNSGTSRTLSVGSDLSVAAGCSLTVGVFNAAHSLSIAGNLTNNGFIRLTNSTVASSTPATGYCNTTFTGAVSNTVLQCNAGSQTRFHNLINQKNTGYELLVQADAGASPQFWANGRNIDPQTGTLRLGNNVVISPLGDLGGNFDIGSSTTIPTLWIDGATIDWGGGNSIVGYGTLRVSAGTLNVGAGASSIVLREAGQFFLEGGTVNAQMFRTSNTASTHRGSYIQSGGTLNLNLATGASLSGYSVFTLPYPENVFKMSGGVINITKLSATNPAGGIQIGSTAENYDVSGGTVNITTTGSNNFDISSGAPFYNLTISRASGSTASVRLNAISGSAGNISAAAQPLVVLNDLTINSANGTVFNALNADVRVGGNLVLNSGATWQAGTNTLVFNGSAAQSFTVNGSLSLSSLQVNKPNGSALTLNGSVSTISLSGGLMLSQGMLADGGKTINVAGNVFNEASHSGSGKIVLNGTTSAQAITGTSTATFGNLELNNSSGASGSVQVTAGTAIRINGNLTLSSNRLFSIGKYELSLSAASVINGSFSSSRFISTNGLRSDAGIRKTFSNTDPVTFPLGSGGNYTPATIQFGSAPASWGTLDIRPAATKQLYVTDPDAFDLYWRIKTTGFSGIPAASITYTFGYGNLTDNATYIPSYYNDAAIAFTSINDVSKVDEASNTILFQSVSSTDGDYTAGNPAAFGIVIPFYSRANGNWNNPATWSNAGFGGAAASGIPASNSPVLIGNGSTLHHTVTVTSNNTISGSLIVDAGSVLDLQTTTGNNFGAIPYATAGGSGKIRISSSSATAVFPAGDFGLFFLAGGGSTEYYSISGQDFTIPSLTDAPNAISIDTYRNIILNPGAGRVISMPEKNLLVYGNLEVNGNVTGRVRFPNAAARTQTVKGNLSVSSGILEFSPAFSQTLNLEGNASVFSGGTIQSVDTGSVVHTLAMSKNLLNEGSLLLNRTSKVNLKFQSDSGRVFSGSNPSAVHEIGQLQVYMGTSAETALEMTALGTLSAPADAWLTISKGTLKISRSGNLTLSSTASNFTIPAAGGLVLNHSGLAVTVGDVNSASADLILGGNLHVLNGTLNIGNNLYNQNNDLEYANSGLPEFKVAGTGTVNINGQIRRSINTQQGALIYTQQDNSSVLIRGKNSDVATSQTYDRAKLEILNAGSQFNMSGNSSLTIDRSGNPSGVFFDVYLQPDSSNITGGTITIGTSATPAAQTFIMNNTVHLWSLILNGSVNAKTLTLNGNPLTVQDDLQILGNSVLNTSGQNVNIGGDFVNQNSASTAGLNVGGYRPVTSAQVTTFNGTLSAQTITGSGSNLTNFAHLVLNNNFSTSGVSLSASSAIRVNGNLDISSGLFNTGANLATVTGNLVNNGGHSSSGAGFLVMAGTNQQFISSAGTASFGSLRITNAAGVDVQAPVTLAGNLNLTTGILYISNHLMTLSSTSAVTGSFGPSCMIRLNGVASDAGVTRAYPAAASDFTFPVGVTLRYTPVRVNVTSNAVAGTVNIKPVSTRHPGTTDTLDKELMYYWKMSSTGFSPSTTVSHTFTYAPDDASNGNELSYVTGRFLSGVWAPTQGIPGTVNAASDQFTLSAVHYFEGDFTAGEPSEFNLLTTFYSRNATAGGNWNDPSSWSNDAILKHDGAASVTYPNYNQVVIDSAHTIFISSDGYNSVSMELNGTLDLGNSLGHNFGTVTGNGKVVLRPTAGAQYIFPGGDFAAFVDTAGGTFEFSGPSNGTLPTQATYNHILFTGTGTKNMPNADVRIKGNITISSGSITNSSNRKIYLNKHWTNLVGTSGFNGGTGTVVLEGDTQLITGSTTFGNLTLAGAGEKSLASSIVLSRTLTLTDGKLVTGANQVTINATGSVTGGSSLSYVNGTLRRGVGASSPSLSFPIGDGAGYAPLSISFTGATSAGGFLTASSTGSEHPLVYTSGIHPTKNTNRFWTVTNSGVGGFTSYSITLNHLPSELDADAVPASFALARYASSAWTMPATGSVTSTSVQGIAISGTTFGDFVAGVGVGGKIWTGAISSDWNLAGNWTPSGIPLPTENAMVGPVLNLPGFLSGSSGVCKSLYLLSGAGIDIPAGYQLSVGLDAEATGNTISGAGLLKINGTSSLSGTLDVNANLEVAAGSSLTMLNGSVLNLGRNLAVNGTMNPGTSQVNMTGALNTTISGNAQFYNLSINKAASQNSVQLLSNISVSNNLEMQSGDILLNGKDLDLGGTGTLINETDSSRVGGPGSGSIRATRLLNAPASVNVAGLGVTISSAANLGSTQVIRRHDQIVYGLGFGINRRVEIHPSNNSALDATLVMSYFESELNTPMGLNPENDLDLWRFNGSNWDKQNGSLDMAANTVTKSGIPQFSEWIIASEINAPLAMNLAYARVDCELKGPVLRWKSLDSRPGDQLCVQVSADGRDWNFLSSILPSDRESSVLAGFAKPLPAGISAGSLIRLKVRREDGSEDHSQPLMVNCSENGINPAVILSPNPGSGLFRMEFPRASQGEFYLRVFNALGQEVHSENLELKAAAAPELDLRNFPAGIYRLAISSEGDAVSETHTLIIR